MASYVTNTLVGARDIELNKVCPASVPGTLSERTGKNQNKTKNPGNSTMQYVLWEEVSFLWVTEENLFLTEK